MPAPRWRTKVDCPRRNLPVGLYFHMPTRKPLKINLPLKDRQWIEAQVADKCFESVDAAVGYLVRSARAHQTREAVEQALVAGLESGPARPFTPRVLQGILARATKRIARAKEAPKRRKSA